MERHRFALAVAIATTPIAALIGFGCSDDEGGPATRVNVDPGGTFGAEVSVQVVGRGRVTGSIAGGIDCPSKCYVRYTFANATAPGAAAGLGLKAIATPGTRFAGWTFETDALGTKGRGPDNCNPVKRPASQAQVDTNATEINLAFGETNGSPPAGQEGACAGSTTVPVAYKLVAKFEEITIPDAGFDADDGGPGELVYDAPAVGATGGELGIVSGRLYWKYTVGGLNGIASGTTSSGLKTPVVVVPPSSVITRFEADTSNIVYQTSAGTIGVLNGLSPTSPNTSFTGGPTSCDAVDSYSNTIYCVAGGTLYSWPYTGGTATVVLTGAPASTKNFTVDSSYFYFVNDPGGAGAASIVRMYKFDANGDAGTFTPIVTGETNPIRLQVGAASYLYWLQYDPANQVGAVRASSTSGGTVYNPMPAMNGLAFMTPDPNTSSYVFGAVIPQAGFDGMIQRGYVFSNTPTTTVSGIRAITGITADSFYVYWTQNDGRVYRRPR